MKIAHQAVWTVESRLRESLSLESVAAGLGVSAFHLARAFSASHGMSLMRYVRRRRLAEAAQALVNSNARVIDIAMEAGYGSQEAFTRAFVSEFATPPQTFRNQPQRPVKGLEAILMEPDSTIVLQPPRIVSLDALRLIGLARRYNEQTSAQIPDQWAKFNELNVAPSAAEPAYGVCYNTDVDGNMDYLCGVEVPSFEGVPENRDRLTVPAQTYAVFAHQGHVSEIRRVWQAIWNQGLVDAKLTTSQGPEIEKYPPEFDPETGNGGFEIWIPVKSA